MVNIQLLKLFSVPSEKKCAEMTEKLQFLHFENDGIRCHNIVDVGDRIGIKMSTFLDFSYEDIVLPDTDACL